MYSPADLPSNILAAPAKKRIWSTIGGISSAMVTWLGLPVLRPSASTSAWAFFSTSSAKSSSAFCRFDGVRALPVGERLRRGSVRVVDVLLVGDRRGGVLLAGARVDQRHGGAADGVDELAADEILNSRLLVI